MVLLVFLYPKLLGILLWGCLSVHLFVTFSILSRMVRDHGDMIFKFYIWNKNGK